MGKSNRGKKIVSSKGARVDNSESSTTKIVVAVIGAIGTVLAAIFIYIGNRQGATLPIGATQTAEALHTFVVLKTNTWEALNTSVASTFRAQLSLSAPTFTETLFPSLTSEPTQTETASPTSTPTFLQHPIIVTTSQPPIVDSSCIARVTFNEPIYFNEPPRIDLTFTAICVSETYKPIVVVKDWTDSGNLFGWWEQITGPDGGSGTYTLTGITLGTPDSRDSDCHKNFIIYMIMTSEERMARPNGLPNGPRTETTVVHQC